MEHRLRQEGIKFLFVMTLHPDDPYEPYRRTRTFYEGLGFDLALAGVNGPTKSRSNRLAYYLKVL